MTPEGIVKNQIKKLLDMRHVFYFLPVSGGYGSHGIPDFVCCHQGRFFGIEAKAKGKKPTALQEMQRKKIEAAGGKWFLVDSPESLDEVRRWIDEASA